MTDFDLRSAVIDAAQRMTELGLNGNNSGNVSAACERDGLAGFLITPTGVPYESLTPESIAWMPLSAKRADEALGPLAPSSEWAMHREVYRARKDARAVVHTHSTYATALACRGEAIPPFHYMVAVSGASAIPVVGYATFGSEALAARAGAAMKVVRAALLEHHGVLTCGGSLQAALSLALEVEHLAHQYVIVKGLGDVRLIPADEMSRIIEKFKTYGQMRKTGDVKEAP